MRDLGHVDGSVRRLAQPRLSFKKPFRAVPVRLAPRYRAKPRQEKIEPAGREAKFLLLVGDSPQAVEMVARS